MRLKASGTSGRRQRSADGPVRSGSADTVNARIRTCARAPGCCEPGRLAVRREQRPVIPRGGIMTLNACTGVRFRLFIRVRGGISSWLVSVLTGDHAS